MPNRNALRVSEQSTAALLTAMTLVAAVLPQRMAAQQSPSWAGIPSYWGTPDTTIAPVFPDTPMGRDISRRPVKEFQVNRSNADAVTCDQLTDQPGDRGGIGPGIDVDSIRVDAAWPVCLRALQAAPDNARYLRLAGRVAFAARRFDDAYQYLDEADRAGDVDGANLLGILFADGLGVKADTATSLAFFLRSANNGSSNAFENGAVLILGARRPDYAAARVWLQQAANHNSAKALLYLGGFANAGISEPTNHEVAFRRYLRAARLGNLDGMQRVGLMYLDGVGTQQDSTLAAQWLKRAADKGHVLASFAMGDLSYRGVGGPPDYAASFQYYQRAADTIPSAQRMVGLMLDVGAGVRRDPALAVKWFRFASDHGDAVSMYQLGQHLLDGNGVAMDSTEAVRWLKLAAGHRQSAAESDLGKIAYHQKEYGFANTWFDRAAADGDGVSLLYLGTMYEFGEGVAKNQSRAASFYVAATKYPAPKVAQLGQEFYDKMMGQSRGSTPAKPTVKESSDSDFWLKVAVGAIAIVGVASLLSSGQSSSSDAKAPQQSYYDMDNAVRMKMYTQCMETNTFGPYSTPCKW